MASTNKTTNYELSQFIETDRPAWLTDYNGDMRTIDSTMKAISDVASGASGSISELADRMSTAEGNITTNTNDIAALDARADALEAGAQSTAGTIANIQTEQTAQNLGIEAATELGYNLARPYDSASTYAVGAYVLFQNTLYKCIAAVPVGEAFDPTKWLAIKATDEISSGGNTWTTNNNFASDLSTDITGWTGQTIAQNSIYDNKLFMFKSNFMISGSSINLTANTLYELRFKIDQTIFPSNFVNSPEIITAVIDDGGSGAEKYIINTISTNSGKWVVIKFYTPSNTSGTFRIMASVSGLLAFS